ncbi:hypothetical protein CDAR_127691 [Caerostris darwini]|uniref:Uncharacterized protein n=1 Tax=Caerostris darwini TaxID=1538125 RepID=A0AAV4QBQ7_9ARAC|nr:hypothetical protein CDAR_127691 [Caerostris darwini]
MSGELKRIVIGGLQLKLMVPTQFYDEEKKLRVIVSDLTTINDFQTAEADSQGARGYIVSDLSDFTATDLEARFPISFHSDDHWNSRMSGELKRIVIGGLQLKLMVPTQFYDEEKKLRVIVSDLTTINGFQTAEADSHGARGYVVSDLSDFTATDFNNQLLSNRGIRFIRGAGIFSKMSLILLLLKCLFK